MASKMAQAASKNCEICMRAPGLHYCAQCDQVFCDDCKMSHLRMKISRNHIFMTGTNIKTETKVGCTDHDEDFIYLCEDCNQLICRLCVTKAHKKHAVVDVKESNKDVQTEISKYLDSKLDSVRSNAKLIGERTTTYKTEVEATVKVIIEHGNLIKGMVDKKVESLIKALREIESIELQSLSGANKDCKGLVGEATRQQQIYQAMIKQSDQVALFQKMKKIKSDIDNLKTVDVTTLPSAKYNRENVNYSDIEKLFGNLTFQETEVTVNKVKLSTKPKQEKQTYQPPIRRKTKVQKGPKSTAVKQYRYQCYSCGTERLSEAEPIRHCVLVLASGLYSASDDDDYGAILDCAKCGMRRWHDYKEEA